MKFQAGNNGKPKGAVNQTTKQVKEVISTLLEKEFQDIEQYKEKLTPSEWLNVLVKLVPYVVPKQTETNATINTPQQVDWERLFK